MKVIDPFDYEELIKHTEHDYGFNLEKDLKSNDLERENFSFMLQDLFLSINASPKKCQTISTNGSHSVYKTRHKDVHRNIGSSGAYRLLSMADGEKAFPFHLYHKKSGKKPKKDLTEVEKKTIKRMVNDAYCQNQRRN